MYPLKNSDPNGFNSCFWKHRNRSLCVLITVDLQWLYFYVLSLFFFLFFLLLIIWTEGWEIKGELILPVTQARVVCAVPTPPLGLLLEPGGRPSTKASSCLKWLVQVCAAIPPYCGGEYSISICPDSSAGSMRKASRVYLLFSVWRNEPTVCEKVCIFLLNSYTYLGGSNWFCLFHVDSTSPRLSTQRGKEVMPI